METRYTDLSDPRKPGSIDTQYYRAPEAGDWQGRDDGPEAGHRRWHQGMRFLNLIHTLPPIAPGATVLIGFACDEGVRRNKGRTGAAEGPDAIRKALANLPFNGTDGTLWDAGDICCMDAQLERAQEQLGLAVSKILGQGGRPIVLGGGHEVTFGHYLGIRQHLHGINPDKRPRLGLINFDAHFDNREPGAAGPSSGTGFWQIGQQAEKDEDSVSYLAIGIQPAANTRALFERADQSGATYITARELQRMQPYRIPQQLETFLSKVDLVYLTIDLDVFAAAYAPGVSATTPLGLLPDQIFFNCLDTILESGKVLSLDFAELNPALDPDYRTAKLAAALIFSCC